MTSSAEAAAPAGELEPLPPALSSMWRLCRLGYRQEPRLMLAAFVLSQLAAVPDALIALWMMLLGYGVLQHRSGMLGVGAAGLALSATGTWFLRTVSTRVQRRFRDKVTIALESHVARLQASVATIAHQERPEYLDRLAMLRDQVFVLDHMYMSVFATCGWILRLGVTLALLASIHPALRSAGVSSRSRPSLTSTLASGGRTRRAGARRAGEPTGAAPLHRGDHGAAGKEVRVAGIGGRLAAERRARGTLVRGRLPRRAAARPRGTRWRGRSSAPAYVGAIVFVASVPARRRAPCCSCWRQARACRPTSAQRSVRSGFCAASGWTARAGWRGSRTTRPRSSPPPICPVPDRLRRGIRFEHVSFAYPGTTRLVLEDVSLTFRRVRSSRIVGENGAGKTTLVKLLAKMYEPIVGRDPRGRAAAGADAAPTSGVAGWPARFRTSSASSSARATAIGLGDVPRIDDEPAVAARGRARRSRGRRRAVAGRARHAARPDVARRRGGLVRPMAEAGAGAAASCGTTPLLLVLDEPTAALDAETEHALFERYAAARAREPRRHGTGHRSSCRTGSRRCAWPI